MPFPVAREHLVAVVLVAALGAALVVHAAGPLFVEIDEPDWMAAGLVTRDLVTGAAPPARWETAYDERGLSTFGTLNPPVGKLLVGLGGSIDGARELIALLAALNLLAMYLLARRVTGFHWASLAAPALLFLQPIFQFSATHVYVDGPQILFSTAALLAVAWSLAPPSRALLGVGLVFAGLACATKLNAGALAASLGAYLVAVQPGAVRQRMGRLAAAALVPAAVFVGVNPFLWPDPLGRVRAIVSGWAQSSADQQVAAGLSQLAVTHRPEAFARVLSRTVLAPLEGGEIPGWASLWGKEHLDFIAAAGATAVLTAMLFWRLRATASRRRRAISFGVVAAGVAAAFLVPRYAGVVGALDLLGVWALVARARQQGRGSPPALFLTVVAVCLVATALWLPFDWARYYLPAQIWSPVLGAAGLGWLGSQFDVQRKGAGAPA